MSRYAISYKEAADQVIRYCVNCDEERTLQVERRRQSLVVKGGHIEFEAPVLCLQGV